MTFKEVLEQQAEIARMLGIKMDELRSAAKAFGLSPIEAELDEAWRSSNAVFSRCRRVRQILKDGLYIADLANVDISGRTETELRAIRKEKEKGQSNDE